MSGEKYFTGKNGSFSSQNGAWSRGETCQFHHRYRTLCYINVHVKVRFKLWGQYLEPTAVASRTLSLVHTTFHKREVVLRTKTVLETCNFAVANDVVCNSLTVNLCFAIHLFADFCCKHVRGFSAIKWCIIISTVMIVIIITIFPENHHSV